MFISVKKRSKGNVREGHKRADMLLTEQLESVFLKSLDFIEYKEPIDSPNGCHLVPFSEKGIL